MRNTARRCRRGILPHAESPHDAPPASIRAAAAMENPPAAHGHHDARTVLPCLHYSVNAAAWTCLVMSEEGRLTSILDMAVGVKYLVKTADYLAGANIAMAG